jgi:hypothetical protein
MKPASLPKARLSRHVHGLVLATTLGLAGMAATSVALSADAGSTLPKLKTNQVYVETVTQPTELDIENPMSVFKFVHGNLPKQVTVYPTENYYYFSFIHKGHEYAGNLRLDASDRDKGVVNFAYFQKYTEWRSGDDPYYKLLGAQDGVSVKKAGRLAYDIAYKGRSVRFNLVDLSNVKPPESKLGKNEKYIGPVFDESGIQFYLVFNPAQKIFHYVLNEEVPVGESLFQSEVSKSITIGTRTGFAYYQDPYLKRKILIGVFANNSRVNNYFDGPFDQLPDNFIKGNVLHDAIVAVAPEMKGKIDRLGNSPDGATRFSISPYMHYEEESQLSIVVACMTQPSITKADYGLCFVIDEQEDPEESEESEEPEKAAETVTNAPATKP